VRTDVDVASMPRQQRDVRTFVSHGVIIHCSNFRLSSGASCIAARRCSRIRALLCRSRCRLAGDPRHLGSGLLASGQEIGLRAMRTIINKHLIVWFTQRTDHRICCFTVMHGTDSHLQAFEVIVALVSGQSTSSRIRHDVYVFSPV